MGVFVGISSQKTVEITISAVDSAIFVPSQSAMLEPIRVRGDPKVVRTRGTGIRVGIDVGKVGRRGAVHLRVLGGVTQT